MTKIIETSQPISLSQLFETQALKSPDAIAVVFEQESLSYRELNQKANQLARYLQALGVQSEVPVGICMEPGLEAIISIMAILKAGGVCVPLESTYPKERLSFVIEDSQVSVILTMSHLASLPPNTTAQVFNLDQITAELSLLDTNDPALATNSDNLAYLLYTSGSTGVPKGVQVTHANIIYHLRAAKEKFEFHSQDVAGLISNLSYDSSINEIFLPLVCGAKLWIFNARDMDYGAGMGQKLSASEVTLIPLSGSIWRNILQSGWQGKPDLRILCGGEIWTRDLADKLLECGASVWDVYGPTETTVFVSATRIKPGTGPILIETLLDNVQFHILDDHLQPVPVGTPGELCIAGPCVTKGYLNRPEMTAEKFIPNPFTDQPGDRLYKTGDLAQYHANGGIEILGRRDSLVKLRGFRLELQEIECILRQHPAVSDTVVIAVPIREELRLVAYVVLLPHKTLANLELYHFLRQKLPANMIPSNFIPLDRLPLSPNGKLDRQALPLPAR